jgi:hypothetical protein
MFFLGCMEKYRSMLRPIARTLLAHSRMLVRTRLEEKKLLSYRVVVSQIVYRVELGCSLKSPNRGSGWVSLAVTHAAVP